MGKKSRRQRLREKERNMSTTKWEGTIKSGSRPKFEDMTVAMERRVWQRWRIMQDEASTEIMAMLLCRTDHNQITIYDLVLTSQLASHADAEFNPSAFADIELEDETAWRGIIHSHVNMDVFLSSTDWSLIDNMRYLAWFINIVTNKSGKVLTQLDIYSPLRVSLGCELQIIDTPLSEEEVKIIRSEVKEKLGAHRTSYTSYGNGYNSNGYGYGYYRNPGYLGCEKAVGEIDDDDWYYDRAYGVWRPTDRSNYAPKNTPKDTSITSPLLENIPSWIGRELARQADTLNTTSYGSGGEAKLLIAFDKALPKTWLTGVTIISAPKGFSFPSFDERSEFFSDTGMYFYDAKQNRRPISFTPWCTACKKFGHWAHACDSPVVHWTNEEREQIEAVEKDFVSDVFDLFVRLTVTGLYREMKDKLRVDGVDSTDCVYWQSASMLDLPHQTYPLLTSRYCRNCCSAAHSTSECEHSSAQNWSASRRWTEAVADAAWKEFVIEVCDEAAMEEMGITDIEEVSQGEKQDGTTTSGNDAGDIHPAT